MVEIAENAGKMIDLLMIVESWGEEQMLEFRKLVFTIRDASKLLKENAQNMKTYYECEMELHHIRRQDLEIKRQELVHKEQTMILESVGSQTQLENVDEIIEMMNSQCISGEKNENTAIENVNTRKKRKTSIPLAVSIIGAVGTVGATILSGGLAAPVIGAAATITGTLTSSATCSQNLQNAQNSLDNIREDHRQNIDTLFELETNSMTLQSKLEYLSESALELEKETELIQKMQNDHYKLIQWISNKEKNIKKCLVQMEAISNTTHTLTDCVYLLSKQKKEIIHHLSFIINSIQHVINHLCEVTQLFPDSSKANNVLSQHLLSLQGQINTLKLSSIENDIEDFM